MQTSHSEFAWLAKQDYFMAYNYEYPYVDPNRYNSDWMLNEIKTFGDRIVEIDKNLPAYVQKYLDGKYPLAISLDTMNPDITGLSDAWPLIKSLITNGYKFIYLSAGTYQLRVNESVTGITFLSSENAKIIMPGDHTGQYFHDCSFIGLTVGTHESIVTDNCTFIKCHVYHYNPNNYTILITNHNRKINFVDSTMTGSATDSTHIGTQFGIWADNPEAANNSIVCINSKFDHFILNAVFGGTGDFYIDHCTFDYCHTQTIPSGGGCVDFKGGKATIKSSIFRNPGGSSTAGIESEKVLINVIGNYFEDIPVALALQGSPAGSIFSGNFVHETTTINSDSECVITGNYFENSKVASIPYGSSGQFISYTANTTIGNFGMSSNKHYYIRECQMIPAYIATGESITIDVPYSVTLTVLNKNNGVIAKYLIHNGSATLLYGSTLPNNNITVSEKTITISSAINSFLEIGINN